MVTGYKRKRLLTTHREAVKVILDELNTHEIDLSSSTVDVLANLFLSSVVVENEEITSSFSVVSGMLSDIGESIVRLREALEDTNEPS